MKPRDVPGGLPDPRVEDDRGVECDDVVSLLHHRLEPARLDVLLQKDAVVAVVVRRAEAAVDLGRGEDEPAAARERDDLVHRDVGGHRAANATLGRVAGRGTPAIVAAERSGIAFSVHEYEHDPRAASFGLDAVEKLGVDPARVFKTLVADVDGELTVAVVPVGAQLDLRALGKRARMADPKAAERATGYVAGGISPLGQRRRLPTILDESALAFETIHVSAGRRGLELELAPADLLALTGGRTAAVASRR